MTLVQKGGLNQQETCLQCPPWSDDLENDAILGVGYQIVAFLLKVFAGVLLFLGYVIFVSFVEFMPLVASVSDSMSTVCVSNGRCLSALESYLHFFKHDISMEHYSLF